MNLSQINIRDPFVLYESGKYYMYGTRAADFGRNTGGFDVYISDDLEDWSEPKECFNSEKYGLNRQVNWAPEVHKYRGGYYMLASFTRKKGLFTTLRGTYCLRADRPEGPFVPHSNGPVTPDDWECIDGTLYVDKKGEPYLVFCHEHTQITDGTVCCIKLSADLKKSEGEPVELFKGSSPYYIDKKPDGEHYITDGPFMFRTSQGELLMVWSTFIKGKYAQCLARSDNGEINGNFVHLPPLISDDGGHGMIFSGRDGLMLTFHSPNKTGSERPTFRKLRDTGDSVEII